MPCRSLSRTYGIVSADEQKEMSGLEFVQGLANGKLPLNTIAQILGYDVTEAENGRVVVAAEPGGMHLNPWGTVHGGLAATLLDSCMGLAIQSTLEKGIGSTTLEFKIFTPATHHARHRPDHRRGRSDEPRSPRWQRGRSDHRQQGPLARPRHKHMSDLSKMIVL